MRHPRKLCLLLLSAVNLSCGGGPSDAGSALGEAGKDEAVLDALADPAVARAAMGVARHVLYGEPEPESDSLSRLPGRRAFVCAYQEKPTQVCQTGVGDDLAGSLRAAAAALAQEGAMGQADRGTVRLKFDVVTSTEPATFKRSKDKPKHRLVATWGIWVSAGGEVSFLLPSELLEKGLYDADDKGVQRKDVLKQLRKRNDGLGDLPSEFPYEQFETVSWVERDQPGQVPPEVFRLYRLHPYEFAPATAEVLIQRTVWAADHLISAISKEGKIRYRFRVAADKDSSSYNLLRHGGTTYSILQAYDRTRFQPYLLASEQAMAYLFDHCDRDRRTGPWLPESHPSFGESMYVVDPPTREGPDGVVKLGGGGLALVMVDQYVEATGDTKKYLPHAQALARFLVASQKEDGEFLYFPPRHPGGANTGSDDSEYYPGEAILGLIRLYSWDRNQLWLDTAVRAADWLIDVRDKGKTAGTLSNDHWLMLGLSYLYLYTKDQKYSDHSIALARAVEHQYRKNEQYWEEHPDYRGGYYNPPRSTPAATRGEGLGAVLETCQIAQIECQWVEDLLIDTIRHEMLSQYDPDMSFWMRSRGKAFGGWNGGLIDMDIRNDFVQHNMSAVIGAERLLLRKAGVVVPGGPGWMEKRLAGTDFPGIPAEQMASLREATLRFRGATRWEEAERQPGAPGQAEAGGDGAEEQEAPAAGDGEGASKGVDGGGEKAAGSGQDEPQPAAEGSEE